jgi:hypothetical protein
MIQNVTFFSYIPVPDTDYRVFLEIRERIGETDTVRRAVNADQARRRSKRGKNTNGMYDPMMGESPPPLDQSSLKIGIRVVIV